MRAKSRGEVEAPARIKLGSAQRRPMNAFDRLISRYPTIAKVALVGFALAVIFVMAWVIWP